MQAVNSSNVAQDLSIQPYGGNVGIGTNSPSHKLEVIVDAPSTSGSIIYVRNTLADGANSTFGGISFFSSPGTDYSIGKLNAGSASALAFRNANNGTEYMRIDSSGNVGIGTTSPQAKLDVAGDIAISNTAVFSKSGNELTIGDIAATDSIGFVELVTAGNSTVVHLDDNGHVGINNTSPDASLHVDGDVKLSSYTNGLLSVNSVGLVKTEPSIQNFSFGESYAANIRQYYYEAGYDVFPNDLGYKYAELLQLDLLDKASLVMIPTASESGVVATQKPIDGTANFTFSRTTSATRVNEEGLIEKERGNQILYSNSFNTSPTWTATSLALFSGQTGYDGTTDAWNIQRTGGPDADIRQTFTFSGVHTLSVYAKSSGLEWMNLFAGGESVYFDLGNGVTGTRTSNVIDSTVEDAGNGWWRCSITVNYIGASSVRIYPADSDGDTSGDIGNILIQDAQLEQGLVLREYLETTTSAVRTGLVADEPRFDYSDGPPSLLLEPERTNTMPNSEYLSGYLFTRTNGTNNSAISPEGVGNAFKLYADTQTGAHYLRLNYTQTADAVLSVFAKKGEETSFAIGNATASQAVVFNLENGTITSETGGTGTIEHIGNDWYRCSYHRTAWADWQYISLRGNNTTYTGDGTSGIYLYGLQFELGYYPTSYIPTYGSSASRAADACSATGVSNVIGQTEGTLFAEIQGNANALSSNTFLSLAESTGNNRIILGQSSSANQVRFYIDVDAYSSGHNYNVTDITQPQKLAIVYSNSGNNIALYLNGVQKSIFATGDTFSAPLTDITFDNGAGGQAAEFNIKELIVFDSALTQSEAEALTTI